MCLKVFLKNAYNENLEKLERNYIFIIFGKIWPSFIDFARNLYTIKFMN